MCYHGFFNLVFCKANCLWLFLRFLLGFLIVSVNIYQCQLLIVFSLTWAAHATALRLHTTCAVGGRLVGKKADTASPYLVMPSLNSVSIDHILKTTGSSHVLNEEKTEPSDEYNNLNPPRRF